MSPSEPHKTLYELLPAYLRFRDQTRQAIGRIHWAGSEPATELREELEAAVDEFGAPLQALMGVLERQYRALEGDIAGLYDDWFIETCQEWVAPFLGDLLGVRGLDTPGAWFPGQRARIANTLEYRRRKGTVAVIERAVRDVTGWPCVAVPFFERLSVTHSLEHTEAARGQTIDLGNTDSLARLGGPFETAARRPQVSGKTGLEPASGPSDGRNLGRIGLYLWRLHSLPVKNRMARKVSKGCYTFHPLGIDQPLFAPASSPREQKHPSGERYVPTPLDRRILAAELAARKEPGARPLTPYLGERPVCEIVDPATGSAVPADSFVIADLSDWQRPPAVESADGPSTVALDPELGRFAFSENHPGADVRVSYNYAASGELGGGPYDRGEALGSRSAASGLPVAETPPEAPAVARFAALQDALKAWPRHRETAVILIADSDTYGGWERLVLKIPLVAGGSLTVAATHGATPSFIGDLRVVVPAGVASRLILDGLMVGGTIEVVCDDGSAEPDNGSTESDNGSTGSDRHRLELELRHCTVMPPPVDGKPAVAVRLREDAPCEVMAWIESSIVASIVLPGEKSGLDIRNSIVAGACQAGDARLSRTTVFGSVAAEKLRVEESIFTGTVSVTDCDGGYVRHSSLPPDSKTPEREACQGERAPSFVSRRFGQPGYGQLARACPREIKVGAADGSEMGAFCRLRNPFREANLKGILDEYLPWGLEARVFHVT